MANLVSPGYKHSKLINQVLSPIEERILEFKGLNKKTVVEEGEMSDMWNLTADGYPVLKPRKPRGEMDLPADVKRPIRIVKRYGKLGVIAIDSSDGVSFYYDGTKVNEITNLTTSSYAVAINNRMCFFPQKYAIDITKEGVQAGTYKSLEAEFKAVSSPATTIHLTATETYLDVTKGLFNYDDAVTINGSLSYTVGGVSTSLAVEVSCIIEDILKGGENDTTDRIWLPANTFIEAVGADNDEATLVQDSTISRKMPSLDFIVEWNNRLWGCSNTDNTIYACKLGDPFNWEYYQGTGLDSYYAEQGTDELWTGIAEYSGHLIFFKPNSMTRVYGTSPSNYQITNTKAYGIEDGSSNSVLTINDTVFYKSAIGIMAYQGYIPQCISDKLNRKFKNVVAGTEGTKYYASVIIADGQSYEGSLLVFDIAKGMWHKEDNLRFTNSCKVGDKIYCTTASASVLLCDTTVYCDKDLMVSTDLVEGKAIIINPDEPSELEKDIEWRAVFGPFDEYIEEHKIYSKLAMRIKANGEASARVFISINEGPWEQVEYYEHVSTKGDFIPIIPRRCDRYSVKIEGKGNCEIKSLTRRVRQGTFGRL